MAVVVRKIVVCDEGLEKCDNTTLTQVRLSVDGASVRQVLCAKHAAPFLRLQEKMGGAKPTSRVKVYTPEEVAAQRRTRGGKRG